MTTLELNGNQIGDISALFGLTNLTYLWLHDLASETVLLQRVGIANNWGSEYT